MPLIPGSVSIPGGGCAGDVVTLSGMVHVVSILMPTPPPITPPSPVKLHFNMAGVLGTGSVSGNTYVVTGAQEVVSPKPPPITPQGFAL